MFFSPSFLSALLPLYPTPYRSSFRSGHEEHVSVCEVMTGLEWGVKEAKRRVEERRGKRTLVRVDVRFLDPSSRYIFM